MQPAEIRRRLSLALTIDTDENGAYLNLNAADEQLSLAWFANAQDAEAQKEILIDSLVQILS